MATIEAALKIEGMKQLIYKKDHIFRSRKSENVCHYLYCWECMRSKKYHASGPRISHTTSSQTGSKSVSHWPPHTLHICSIFIPKRLWGIVLLVNLGTDSTESVKSDVNLKIVTPYNSNMPSMTFFATSMSPKPLCGLLQNRVMKQ